MIDADGLDDEGLFEEMACEKVKVEVTEPCPVGRPSLPLALICWQWMTSSERSRLAVARQVDDQPGMRQRLADVVTRRLWPTDSGMWIFFHALTGAKDGQARAAGKGSLDAVADLAQAFGLDDKGLAPGSKAEAQAQCHPVIKAIAEGRHQDGKTYRVDGCSVQALGDGLGKLTEALGPGRCQRLAQTLAGGQMLFLVKALSIMGLDVVGDQLTELVIRQRLTTSDIAEALAGSVPGRWHLYRLLSSACAEPGYGGGWLRP